VYIEEQSISQYTDTSEEEFLTATMKVINKWNGETSEQMKNQLKLQHLEK